MCQSSEIFYLTLEEKVELNRQVYTRAKELEKEHGTKFTVVSSGHTSDTIEDQAKELNAIWQSGTDALILITNRLDPNNEGDDIIYLCRTGMNGANSHHNTNYATFHRIENFREL